MSNKDISIETEMYQVSSDHMNYYEFYTIVNANDWLKYRGEAFYNNQKTNCHPGSIAYTMCNDKANLINNTRVDNDNTINLSPTLGALRLYVLTKL